MNHFKFTKAQEEIVQDTIKGDVSSDIDLTIKNEKSE
jgi:hypothetical protein